MVSGGLLVFHVPTGQAWAAWTNDLLLRRKNPIRGTHGPGKPMPEGTGGGKRPDLTPRAVSGSGHGLRLRPAGGGTYASQPAGVGSRTAIAADHRAALPAYRVDGTRRHHFAATFRRPRRTLPNISAIGSMVYTPGFLVSPLAILRNVWKGTPVLCARASSVGLSWLRSHTIRFSMSMPLRYRARFRRSSETSKNIFDCRTGNGLTSETAAGNLHTSTPQRREGSK
jgi:hypothetical protein